MGNMSYCRFENTFHDLEDCYFSMDEDLSDSEARFRVKMLRMCADILDDFGHEIGLETVAIDEA